MSRYLILIFSFFWINWTNIFDYPSKRNCINLVFSTAFDRTWSGRDSKKTLFMARKERMLWWTMIGHILKGHSSLKTAFLIFPTTDNCLLREDVYCQMKVLQHQAKQHLQIFRTVTWSVLVIVSQLSTDGILLSNLVAYLPIENILFHPRYLIKITEI